MYAVWGRYAMVFDLESSLVTLNNVLDGEGKQGTKEEFRRAADMLVAMEFANEGTVRCTQP